MRLYGRALRGPARPTSMRASRARSWAGVLVLAAMLVGLASPPGARGCLLQRDDAGVATRMMDAVADGIMNRVPSGVKQLLVASLDRAHEHRTAADGPADPAVITNCATGVTALPVDGASSARTDRLWLGPFDDVVGFAPSHDPPPPFHPPRVS